MYSTANTEIIQQMQPDAAYAQKRSETIILQITRRFEQQTQLKECAKKI